MSELVHEPARQRLARVLVLLVRATSATWSAQKLQTYATVLLSSGFSPHPLYYLTFVKEMISLGSRGG